MSLEDMGLTDALSKKREPKPALDPEVQFDDKSIPYIKIRAIGRIPVIDLAPGVFNPDHFDVNSDVSLSSFVKRGWFSVDDTWTYASANTVTVPSDATSIYSVGMKIQLTQTTVKYFYVTAVTATTLTLDGGTSYTLTNATISSIYYSIVSNPYGFPHWFSYTPTWGNTGTANTLGNGTITGQYALAGRICSAFINLNWGSTTAGGNGNWTFTLPPPMWDTTAITASGDANDASISTTFPIAGATAISSTVIQVYSINSTGQLTNAIPMIWASTDSLRILITYKVT